MDDFLSISVLVILVLVMIIYIMINYLYWGVVFVIYMWWFMCWLKNFKSLFMLRMWNNYVLFFMVRIYLYYNILFVCIVCDN